MSEPTSFGSGTPAPPPPYYPQEQKPGGSGKGLGCFLWGCLAVVALGIVGTAAIGGLAYFGLTQFRDKFTDTKPATLPQLQLNEEERHAAKTRFDDFRAALDQGNATEALSLNEDELNALISEADPDNPFRDSLRVDIEGDRIVGQLSLPMDNFGLPMFGGRYLNATGELRATLEDGKLDVRLDSATVKGEPLPSQMMAELRRENLAGEVMNRPNARRTLQRLESIEIRDDQLILVPKAASAAGEDEGDGS